MKDDYHKSNWIGLHKLDRIFSLGDFGAVRGTITGDVFKTHNGYTSIIISCKVIINGAHWEWLHRLRPLLKEEIQNELSSEVKNAWEDS